MPEKWSREFFKRLESEHTEAKTAAEELRLERWQSRTLGAPVSGGGYSDSTANRAIAHQRRESKAKRAREVYKADADRAARYLLDLIEANGANGKEWAAILWFKYGEGHSWRSTARRFKTSVGTVYSKSGAALDWLDYRCAPGADS